jgi:uncharacterized protein
MLYSNRSQVMLEIISVDVGRHDFLLTPCSNETFWMIYDDAHPASDCFENLESALEPFGIMSHQILMAFNCFMHVTVDADNRNRQIFRSLSQWLLDCVSHLLPVLFREANHHQYESGQTEAKRIGHD